MSTVVPASANAAALANQKTENVMTMAIAMAAFEMMPVQAN